MTKANKGQFTSENQPELAGAPYYTDPQELNDKIEDYFQNCPDKQSLIVGDKIVYVSKPTLCGLALHLGFADKKSLYDYRNKEPFSNSIKRGLLQIEKEYEMKLDSRSAAGAIFALKNFGWKDKQEIEQTNHNTGLTIITEDNKAGKENKKMLDDAIKRYAKEE